MSEDENPSEKEHEPSQKKLNDARDKGEIARSPDVATAAAYGGFLLACLIFGANALLQSADVLAGLLSQAERIAPLLTTNGTATISGPLLRVLAALAPLFLLPALAVLLATIAQRALIFTPSNILPKLSRISPISGIRNKFGRKGLFEFVKSFVKLMAISFILGLFLAGRADDILNMIYLEPAISTAMLMDKILGFLVLVVLVATLIGGADFAWQQADHLRKNRMSRKELTDEQKQAEGDPNVKASRRQRGQEIALNKMLVDVAAADVVVVNPTHYAVALKWEKGSGRAPLCTAKGVDEIAARIRERAAAAGVPLHDDPPTARLLYATLKIGQEVSPDHFRAVATAIRFAEKMRQKAAAPHRVRRRDPP